MVVQRVVAPTTSRVVLRIMARSAAVDVVADGTEDIEVDAGPSSVVETSEGDAGTVEVQVTSTSDAISVRCPEGVDVILGLTSGRATLAGRFGDVRVTSKSGRVEVEDAASLDVRTSSGRVSAGTCEGECRVMSRSGRVNVAAAGSLRAATKSGRITVDRVDRASAQTASGWIDLVATGRGDIEVRAVSGRVRITVEHDARPRLMTLTRSGRIRNECEEGEDFGIDVKTVSGLIQVVSEP